MSNILQCVILQAAAEHADGLVVVSEIFDPRAVRDAIEDLLWAGWVKIIPTPEGMPTLKTASGQSVAFQITPVGRLADLVAKGALVRAGERRHARYHLAIPLKPVAPVTIDGRGELG